MSSREPYPTDVSDEERALVAPYLALLWFGRYQRLTTRDRFTVSPGREMGR